MASRASWGRDNRDLPFQYRTLEEPNILGTVLESHAAPVPTMGANTSPAGDVDQVGLLVSVGGYAHRGAEAVKSFPHQGVVIHGVPAQREQFAPVRQVLVSRPHVVRSASFGQ